MGGDQKRVDWILCFFFWRISGYGVIVSNAAEGSMITERIHNNTVLISSKNASC